MPVVTALLSKNPGRGALSKLHDSTAGLVDVLGGILGILAEEPLLVEPSFDCGLYGLVQKCIGGMSMRAETPLYARRRRGK